MSIFTRAINVLFPARSGGNQEQLVKQERDFRAARKLKKHHRYQIPMEIGNLDVAIQAAESPLNPDRRRLYDMYEEAMQDGHLSSVWQTRVERVLAEPWVVVEEGKPVGKRFNEEAKKLLYKMWIYDFMRYSMDAKLWGHSLIEFARTREDGSVRDVYLIWREHVKPELGELHMELFTDEAILYRERPWSQVLLEVGDKYDLGLLRKATRLVILKKYSVTDWARRSERYGQPLLGIKTARTRDEELDALEDMASNFGANGYVILDDTDEVQIIESSQAFTWQIFDGLAKRMDDEISKLILGQTMTTDTGANRAQAEVHERQLDSIIEADMRWLTFIINDTLFPFLKKYGYQLDGFRFEFYRTTEEGEQEAREERMGGAAGKYPGQQASQQGNDGGKANQDPDNPDADELARAQKKSPYLNAGRSTAG